MWPILAALAVVTIGAVWVLTVWADRRYDKHAEEALALANARTRHPATRRRCMCGRYLLDSSRDIQLADDQGEPFRHQHAVCQPVRESL